MITFVFFLSLFCNVQLIGLVGRLYQTLFKYVNTFSSKETLLNHCLTYKTVEIIFFQTSQPLHSSHLTMQSKHRTRHSERNPKSSLGTRALELFFKWAFFSATDRDIPRTVCKPGLTGLKEATPLFLRFGVAGL